MLKAATRAFAVVGKELFVVLRRPSALTTLVVGPVVILAVFGLSYVGQPPIRAVLVVPAASGLPTDARAYDLNQSAVLEIVGTRPTLDSARQALAAGDADIMQHLDLTLGALSMRCDRRLGMLALLRVAPVSAVELITGKYVAFVVLTGAITGALVLLMTRAMGVPMLAPVGSIMALLLLLILASVGLGLVLSLVTSSESQVIQLALLALLASVFFGGLAIDLSQFAPPLQAAAQFLPVTEATRP